MQIFILIIISFELLHVCHILEKIKENQEEEIELPINPHCMYCAMRHEI